MTYKKETIRAAKASGSLPVVRYWPPEIKATGYYGHRSTSYLTIFYMTREKHQIVPYSTLPPDDNCLYLVRYMDLARLKLPYERICGVHYDRNYPPINLVRFKLPQDTTGVQ